MKDTLPTGAKALIEIEQIKQLKARYYRLMDSKKWSEWRHCFTDDMRYYRDQDTNPVASSGDAFVAHVSKRHHRSVTVHHGHMPEIELTGERSAKGIWAMFDYVDCPDEPAPRKGYGHYTEEYEKGTDGKWRIKHMRLTRLRVDALPPKS